VQGVGSIEDLLTRVNHVDLLNIRLFRGIWPIRALSFTEQTMNRYLVERKKRGLTPV
jgi:hypothetical protein